MSIGNYFNLIDNEIDTLEIVKESSFDCKIIDKLWVVYHWFLLASSPAWNAHTLCDLNFHVSSDSKPKPRLTFRKTDSSFEDKTLNSGQTHIRISFASWQDWCHAFRKMISFLYSFKHIVDIWDFESHYWVIDPSSIVINDDNSAEYIRKIIDAWYGEEVLADLTESNPDLISKLSHAKIQHEREQDIQELRSRLQSTYSETTWANSWQRRIFDHNRLFWSNYLEPIEKQKINLTWVMPDYLFPTIDWFIDVLEIKLPDDQVILSDANHAWSWRRTGESNKAIWQVVNYLCEIGRLQLENEKIFEEATWSRVSFLKPRAFILIWNSENWDLPKKKWLRKLNYYLHNIQILTYNELVERWNQFINPIQQWT